jgi:hypothetical protein
MPTGWRDGRVMRRGQRWAVPAVLTMVAAGVVVVSSPVTAATPAAAIPARVTGAVVDLGVSGADSMVTAGGKLFIAVGNQVLVRDLVGKPLGSIGNETGVSQLAVSEDGTTVFAADRGADVISIISAATGQETARWPTSPCPTYLAVTDGFLFYSFGCGSSGSIESLDELAGGPPVGVSDQADFTFSAPPLLTTGLFFLAATVPGSSIITSASVFSSDPTFIGTGDVHVPISDLVASPDGGTVTFTGPESTELDQIEPYSFTSVGTYRTGAPPTAVGFSQTLGQLVVGLDGPGPATMQVYGNGAAAGGTSTQITSTAAAPAGGTPLVAVPRGLTFGPDTSGRVDAMIYGLATERGSSHDYLEIGLAITQSITHLSLGLGSPTSYGKPLLAAVTFPGHPNMPVTLNVVPNSGPSYSIPARTNQWGIAATTIPVTFSGRVYAYYGGDLLTYHEAPAASPSPTYTAPAHTTATLYGSYSTHGGVMYYHSAASVHLHVLMTPPHAVPVRLVLRVYANGVWLVQPTATFLTNKWGDLEVFLTTASKGYLYQVVVSTPGNVFNSAAVPATTPVFAIG